MPVKACPSTCCLCKCKRALVYPMAEGIIFCLDCTSILQSRWQSICCHSCKQRTRVHQASDGRVHDAASASHQQHADMGRSMHGQSGCCRICSLQTACNQATFDQAEEANTQAVSTQRHHTMHPKETSLKIVLST